MQTKQYTGQGKSIVVEESNNGWKQSPVLYERPCKRRSSVPDYLPKWQWALLMRSLELQDRPSHIVINDLRPASKGKHWHTFKVAVTTLVAAPIVLWAVPVVLDFYFAR